MNALLLEEPVTLVDELLAEQRKLTAVERFSRHHDESSARESIYRALMPVRAPRPGEQYAFEVNLDACSSCKACVAACHSLNGLEENETWRGVGLLHGVVGGEAFQQTVTTACHHCIDPGCLNGCPVKAYDKDPFTGIVRHLDDQCIGCQYCIMKCPYEVPKYSKKLGIVRKCDLCSSRLAEGEAPACAQACPNHAIKIALVRPAEVRALFRPGAPVNRFLADSPNPAITLPTTRYLSARLLNETALAGDHSGPRLEHPHWPLVIMLLLTQASVGMFLSAPLVRTNPVLHLCAFALLTLGLSAAPLHLGQPLKAWRAFLGWRTSWLSREIIAFNLFAAGAGAATALAWLPFLSSKVPGFAAFMRLLPTWVPPLASLQPPLSLGVGLAGLGCVFVSGMVYVDTKRACWSPRHSFGGFFGTAILLGAAGASVTLGFLGKLDTTRGFVLAGLAVGVVMLVWREMELGAALSNPGSPIHLNARAVKELLPRTILARRVLFMSSTLFGVLALANVAGVETFWVGSCALSTLLSELVGRYVFFAAGAGKRMPGGISA